MSIWDEITAERLLLADLIEGLSPEQLAGPSLCGKWTVRDVAGHLIVPLSTPRAQIGRALLRARGNFDRANAALAVAAGTRGPMQIAAVLRERAGSHFTPPFHGPTAPLTDLLVHGQDMRRPLGLAREFVPDRMRSALDFLVSPRARVGFVPRGRLDGLRFVATDLDWTHGAGAEVRGPGEALLLAMTGRDIALGDLTGDGVAVLGGRAAAAT